MEPKEMDVKLSDIVPGEEVGLENFRIKTGFDTVSIRELADSISASGLIERLKLWKNIEDKTAKLGILDGERRHRALKLLKQPADKLVPVVVYECSRVEALALALENYAARSDVTPFELAAGIDRMQQAAGKLSYDDIAARVHKSKPWVSRNYGAYRMASDELRDAWGKGKIPAETAINLAQLPTHDQPAAVEQQLKERETGGKKAAGKARKQAKGRKAESVDRPGIDDLRSELHLFGDTPSKKIEDLYVRGVVDAMRWMNGDMDYVDFASSYEKTRTKLAKEQEKAAAEAEKTEKPVKPAEK